VAAGEGGELIEHRAATLLRHFFHRRPWAGEAHNRKNFGRANYIGAHGSHFFHARKNDLSSPAAWEYAGGVARQFGGRASVRADVMLRHYVNFYMRQADLTTGRVQDPEGRPFDLTLIVNAPDGLLSRDYAGGTFTGSYRFGTMVDIGANYTLSKAWGNFDGETVASGPVPFDYRYPEYKQESWNFPEGDLAVDQRHRARLWLNYNPAFAPGLTLSVLQALESGVPYGAANTNGIDPRPYVTNPGNAYLTPPASTLTTYYFGPRDEFHTDGQ
jgi:hypothetical protein